MLLHLPLPRLAKSLVVAGGYGSIAIPSSLPFAMFAMDFGKEGAAMLSSILSAVGFGASLLFLHLFPPLLKRHGWRGVYGTLAALGLTAALAMSSIMFSDYSKFSRGNIITSSLLNETVVTLHACEKCTFAPMWRPGARRTYSYAAAKRNYSPLRPHARGPSAPAAPSPPPRAPRPTPSRSTAGASRAPRAACASP